VMDMDLRVSALTEFLDVDPSQAAENKATRPNGAASGTPIQVPTMPGVRLMALAPHGVEALDDMMARIPLLIDEAIEAGSVVIIDTAPVGVVADTLRIVPMCEAVVFVARTRRTSRRQLVLARDLLLRSGAKLAGMVLVGQPIPGATDSDSYHRYSMRLDQRGQPPSTKSSAKARSKSVSRSSRD
jgi:tyrosine-protein kinase Etk/Wzc